MALFFKKAGLGENRIENSGRWPVRLTQFQLIDDYEFPATNFPEFFFVQEGSFLHETDAGTQSIREGAAIMVNPGLSHTIKQPEDVVLSRIRFLPEWLTREYEIIANSPTVLSLFFDQSWFRYPRDENLHVFTTRSEGAALIRAELEYLRNLLKEQRQLEPITRVSLLKLMMLLADEHHRFWRGVSEVEMLPESKYALDQIESCVLRAEEFDPAKMSRGGFEKRTIEKSFGALTGMTLGDYARRRRAFHAAERLLSRADEPRRISKELGYSTTAEFGKQFESVFDISPAVYRQKFGVPLREKTDLASEKEGA
ncbi:MAG: helix-turn-helix domain-containing protein [Verrucomicrobiales bacterium]|jgi:AraC-like DNA-binding protein|nr:helix-turn-helix domain-containing protein [Verrucomicrobiales bacterium]MBP9226019.1 helix-turn-helix domain-containing protein [Verrucomicrobiales bacterium]HQZ26672.1 helix-turn-helix domain-containing protein [Verrucomicrobiales bacterium]